jgi:hypothetical protein
LYCHCPSFRLAWYTATGVDWHIPSFNAQPQAPAIFVVGPGRAGTSGGAVNAGMCQSTPVAL